MINKIRYFFSILFGFILALLNKYNINDLNYNILPGILIIQLIFFYFGIEEIKKNEQIY